MFLNLATKSVLMLGNILYINIWLWPSHTYATHPIENHKKMENKEFGKASQLTTIGAERILIQDASC